MVTCEQCGKPARRRFCSNACWNEWRIGRRERRGRTVVGWEGTIQYCGHRLSLSGNSRYPLARAIASVALGRLIDREECVLYKDGDKANLDPENLVIVPRHEVPRIAKGLSSIQDLPSLSISDLDLERVLNNQPVNEALEQAALAVRTKKCRDRSMAQAFRRRQMRLEFLEEMKS